MILPGIHKIQVGPYLCLNRNLHARAVTYTGMASIRGGHVDHIDHITYIYTYNVGHQEKSYNEQ